MFSRLRETIRIVSYKHKPLHPDLLSDDGDEVQVSKTSSRIGNIIELNIIGVVTGFVGHYIYNLLSGHRTSLSAGTLVGIAGAAVALLLIWFFDSLNHTIQLSIKLGEKLAPYFGHKIEEAVRTLKG